MIIKLKRRIMMTAAIALLGALAFFAVQTQCVYADDDIVARDDYYGVPWKITSDTSDEYVLYIGDDDEEYTFDYIEYSPTQEDDWPWSVYNDQIAKVYFLGTVNGNGSCAYMFNGFENANNIYLSGFNTENVDNMRSMFEYCVVLDPLDFSNFDTGSVTDMSRMFNGCGDMSSIDVSGFDTRNVTDMSEMFRSTNLLSLDLSNFNTGNVTDMTAMFEFCDSLKRIKIGNWSYASITSYQKKPKFWLTMYDPATGEAFNESTVIPEMTSRTYVRDYENNRVSGNITVTYNPAPKRKLENSIVGYYSDDFFKRSNESYDKELADFSLLTTMASMSKQEKDKSKRNAYIKSLLSSKLKFRGYKSSKYNVTLDNDKNTVGYSFAYKYIDGDTVLAVVIRSGGYGSEWASNGRVGNSGKTYTHHNGFYQAANAVLSDLYDYMDDNFLDVDKVWICGYSRGGAVSNILGRMVLNDEIIPAKNLYCYTFEAPTTTHTVERTRGIYNTISLSDPIPLVPLTQWGYRRYGTDEYIYSSKVAGHYYTGHLDEVQQEVSKLTGNQYKSVNKFDTYKLLNLLNWIVGGTEKSYVSDKKLIGQTDVVRVLNSKMGGEQNFLDSKKDAYNLSEVLKALKVYEAGMQIYPKWALEQHENSLFQQHWPEVTYAWMKYGEMGEGIAYKQLSVRGTEEKTRQSASQTKGTASAKSVSEAYTIRVYDSANTLVAEINSDDCETFMDAHPDIALDVAEGVDGELMILLPEDDEYHISIEPTKDMELDYKVSEFTGNNVASRAISYRKIELEQGDVLTGTSEEGVDIDSSTYNPTINGTETVEPDAVTEGDALAAVTVSIDSQGNGYALGSGAYADGDIVTLQAVPLGTATFGGWYENNTLISSDKSYQITAEQGNDRNILAKFKTNLSDCTVSALSTTKYVYNGKSRTPGATVKCNFRTLTKNTDYTITYKSNKNVGTGTATISGKGVYQGKVTKKFTINPQGTSISKLTKGKKKFTVKWKKKTTQTTGYQIRYSLKSTMASSKTVTVKSNKTTSKTIKKLKAKKSYYVQVRTYKTVSGKKYYSAWSKKKSVKTK